MANELLRVYLIEIYLIKLYNITNKLLPGKGQTIWKITNDFKSQYAFLYFHFSKAPYNYKKNMKKVVRINCYETVHFSNDKESMICGILLPLL